MQRNVMAVISMMKHFLTIAGTVKSKIVQEIEDYAIAFNVKNIHVF